MKYFVVIMAFAYFSISSLMAENLVINEVMTSNNTSITDETGQNYDWIELYNPNDSAINLDGYFLSDDPENPYKWKFGNYLLEGNSYLIVWASGRSQQFETIAPDSVGDLMAWFKADDSSSLTLAGDSTDVDGRRVSKWNSNDVAYFAFQDDSAHQPLFIENAIGDKPAVRLDGKDDLLYSNFYGAQSNSPRTIMAVVANANMTGANVKYNNHIVHYGSYGTGKCYGLTFQSESHGGSIGNNYWNKELYGTKRMDRERHILSNVYDGVSDNVFVDSYLYGQTDIELNTGNYSNLKIGSKIGSDGEFYGGDIAELIVYNSALDSINLKRVENYLVRKYEMNHISFHTNFKLGSGEAIILTKADSSVCDSIYDISSYADYSFSSLDGDTLLTYYASPTPGAPNATIGVAGKSELPVFSKESGFYEDSVVFDLTTTDTAISVYYTLDGSVPTKESFKYEHAIKLVNNSQDPNRLSLIKTTLKGEGFDTWEEPTGIVYKFHTVRARAFKDNYSPSEVVSRSFIVDKNAEEHFKYPVISLVTDSLNFFDNTIGIYKAGTGIDSSDYKTAHYYQSGDEWERPVSVEIFTPDGGLVLQQNAGVRIHGNFSTTANIKSLRLYARKEYGEGAFNYQFFPDVDQNNFKRILLRTTGQDYAWSYMRDAFMQNLVNNVGLDIQHFNLSEVYLNGEFWGIHYIRERFDKFYIEENYGIDEEELDLIQDANSTVEGDINHYADMLDFINSNFSAMNDSVNYEYLKTQMDCDNYIYYISSNLFFGQNDWPQNNIKYWRKKTDRYEPDAPYGHDGRWRWFLFDTDYGFGRVKDYSYNIIKRVLFDLSGWSPRIMQSLIGNDVIVGNTNFRENFVNTMADLMNSNFKEDRLLFKIDSMKQLLLPKMDEHIERWAGIGSITNWNSKIEVLRDFARYRSSQMRSHLIESIAQIEDTALVTLSVNDHNFGSIKINKLLINNATIGLENADKPYPWQGIYFKGVPVSLTAVPKAGYEFVKWSNDVTDETIKVDLEGGELLEAYFKPIEAAEGDLVINEVRHTNTYSWIEIYNASEKGFHLKDYTLKSSADSIFVFDSLYIAPNSYFVITSDTSLFNNDYNHDVLLASELGFQLGNKTYLNLAVSMGYLIDSVALEEMNAEVSYEVIEVKQSNAEASNWQPSYLAGGTPGVVNSTPAYAVVINEIMAKNNATIATKQAKFEDWIEIYNPLDIPVDIAGLQFTDNAENPSKSQVYSSGDSTIIPAKGFILLWADGDTTLGVKHLDFKLSTSGEFVGVYSPDGKLVIDSISFGQQQADVSIGSEFDGGENWIEFAYPTPDSTNFKQVAVQSGDIAVTEIMFDNEDSNSGGYIELYNSTENKYLLRDWSIKLSEGGANEAIFTITDNITIERNSYLVICADTSRFKAQFPQIDAIYGDMGAVKDISYIQLLSDKSLAIASVDNIAALKSKSDNSAIERVGGDTPTWQVSYLESGTPGAANSTPAYKLRINEVMASNSATISTIDGAYEDWIELYNPLDTVVDVAGLYLSDDAANPLLHKMSVTSGDSTLVASKGFMLLWADKNLEKGFDHINFKISTLGESVVLLGTDGLHIIDQVDFAEQTVDVSYGLTSDAGDTWDHFIKPTPGATNDIVDGVDEAQNFKVLLYPNPVSDVLYIKAIGSSRVEMINIMGERVLSQPTDVNQSIIKLDISRFASGMYLLNIFTDKGVPTSRRVILRR